MQVLPVKYINSVRGEGIVDLMFFSSSQTSYKVCIHSGYCSERIAMDAFAVAFIIISVLWVDENHEPINLRIH